MATPSPDFKDVAARALAMADVLLPEWIGGHRVGNEWKGERKANGGPGDSWCINVITGKWIHGASGRGGLDMISMYAAKHNIDNLAALHEVYPMTGITDKPVKTLPLKPQKDESDSVDEIPPDAPPIPDHHQHGPAAAVYRYGLAFVIARYHLPDGVKTFCPFTWRSGRWVMRGYPAPRPIYGAEILHKMPDVPVLIVEGEKACDAARGALPSNMVVTWAGGAAGVDKNDWGVLKGRDVIIWPDADEPGWKAGARLAQILVPIAERVRIVDTHGQPEGWDIANAIEEKWDAKRIAAWVKERIKAYDKPPKANGHAKYLPKEATPPELDSAVPDEYIPARKPEDQVTEYPMGVPPPSSIVTWAELGLMRDSKQVPHPTMSNASLVLQRHPYFRDKLWYDSFRGKVYHSLNGEVPRLWGDADTRRATAFIQQQLQLPKINLMTVHEAMMHAAECNQRNSLLEWLNSLKWDGVERLDTWLFDCLGVERNPYNDAVSRNWPISMVARAYSPGCQVDTMPVLEGSMGRGKSRFLEELGSPWFAAIQIAFGEKDFFQAIQGRWLIEIPDMSGFSRRDVQQILATITNRNDVYRKSHGRITEEHPRVTVFAATSETDDYLKDQRGRRRYWPLRCGYIDLDVLHQQRSQVFAEAVVRYQAGSTWYEMPTDETDEEQRDRAAQDLWTDPVMTYVESAWANQKYSLKPIQITIESILRDALEMPAAKHSSVEAQRVVRILREHDWMKTRNSRGRFWVKIERKK